MGRLSRKKDQLIFEKGHFRGHWVNDVMFLSGQFTIFESGYFAKVVLKHMLDSKTHLAINLNGLEKIDSAGVIALFYARRKMAEAGQILDFTGGSDSIQYKMKLFRPDDAPLADMPVKQGFLESIGGSVNHFFTVYVFGFLLLAANIFYWSINDLFKRKVRREGEFVNQSVQIGVNALLIVVFLSLVIGFVMALQSASQLRMFGANIFVVDLVVIAIMSQMGPLITAVLVAGRSGSAIAAEIATMKVTSELDALTTMGFNPIRFVVVPKLYACLFTMPFLVIMANASGVFGGAIAANIFLDITPEIFINRTAEVMTNKHLITSFVKSQVYASLIVLTGSFYGFRVVRGAEGVGKVTTTSVVVAITLVVLADSILGIIFF